MAHTRCNYFFFKTRATKCSRTPHIANGNFFVFSLGMGNEEKKKMGHEGQEEGVFFLSQGLPDWVERRVVHFFSIVSMLWD